MQQPRRDESPGLGGEGQAAVVLQQVERLDAEGVARQPGAPVRPDQAERIHPGRGCNNIGSEFLKIIIRVEIQLLIPTIFIDSRFSFCHFIQDLAGAFFVFFNVSPFSDHLLQVNHQGIKVNRHKIDHFNGRDILLISKPPVAEINPAFRSGSQIAIHLLLNSARAFCHGYIFLKALRSWSRSVVPIPIQDRSVSHSHHSPVGFARFQFIGTFHPKIIFFF